MTDTASQITAYVLEVLPLYGFDVWRQNNHATKGRSFIGRKGLPDVIGFHRKTGLFVAVEVKAGKDNLSPEQVEFLASLNRSGGLGVVATDRKNFLKYFLESCAENAKLELYFKQQ